MSLSRTGHSRLGPSSRGECIRMACTDEIKALGYVFKIKKGKASHKRVRAWVRACVCIQGTVQEFPLKDEW